MVQIQSVRHFGFFLFMVIFLQFTVTDVRSFTKEACSLLSKPTWPTPTPYKEFVRGVGPIVARSKGGIGSWVGENYVCRINNGIRIPNRIKINESTFLNTVSKHLYSVGNFVLNKYEIVFHLSHRENRLDNESIKHIIDVLLDCPASIRGITGGFQNVSCKMLNKELRKFHVYNSTCCSMLNGYESLAFVNDCAPQIYFLSEGREFVHLFKKHKLKLVTQKKSSKNLFGGWYNSNNHPVRIWLQLSDDKMAFADSRRDLRISIMRLHSEFECLKNVLKLISNRILVVMPKSKESDLLQWYFNRAIRFFVRHENEGIHNGFSDLFDPYVAIYASYQPGELQGLEERISEFNFRPQIQKKISNLININKMTKINVRNYGSIGAIGKKVRATKTSVGFKSPFDKASSTHDSLMQEIKLLKEHLTNQATQKTHLRSLKQIEKAEEAARAEDESTFLKHLKAGGKWVWDVSTKIGVNLITEYFKRLYDGSLKV